MKLGERRPEEKAEVFFERMGMIGELESVGKGGREDVLMDGSIGS